MSDGYIGTAQVSPVEWEDGFDLQIFQKRKLVLIFFLFSPPVGQRNIKHRKTYLLAIWGFCQNRKLLSAE